MVSTPAVELANEILQDCLQYGTWPLRTLETLLDRALDPDDCFLEASGTRALFSILVEGLADRFEPKLCSFYAEMFSHVVARALPEFRAEDLVLRYNHIRQRHRFWGGDVRRVYILSRVTLGADVAVTSVAIAGLKERFPGAEICLVGPAKNAELFSQDSQVVTVPVTYDRSGTLRERLAAALELQELVEQADAIVVDPDSRLTQLGIVPCCDDSRYYFFESRAFGGSSDLPLPVLTANWLSEVFGIESAVPYVAPEKVHKLADFCVSWGVGENENKRLSDEFEAEALSCLLKKGGTVLLDRGAGGEETARADRLDRRLNSPRLKLHTGSYASFASHIAQSRLYVGYDSAGQHVACASRVPLISVFGGYVCDRMMHRWRPAGPHATVILFGENDRDRALEASLKAIEEAA
ncbi:MAG: glycosyltransferase family 9 protein [Bryobacteraceae bacterium]